MSDSDFFDLPIRLHAVNGVHIAARVGGDGPLLLCTAIPRPAPSGIACGRH